MSEQDNSNNNQESGSKVEKKYQATLGKLTAILGGKEKLLPDNKIPNTELDGVIQELFKEEREAKITTFKNNLKELLKKYAEMIKSIKEKKKELEKLEIQKKEEFVKAAQNVLGQVDDIVSLEKEYAQGLAEVKNAEPEEKIEE